MTTNRPSDDGGLMEGFLSVRSALLAGRREVRALWLRADRAERRLTWLAHAASDAGARVERVSMEDIDARASGQTHGGVLAEVGPRHLLGLDGLIPRSDEGSQPFVAMLDGVEDPFNFGQAVRALYTAGCDGLVVRPRNWLSATAVVTRASAGATEFMATAMADTAAEAADYLRGRGLVVATTAGEGGESLFAADLRRPLFLLIGGEKRGVTRSFLAAADLVLTIPYGRDFGASLGVTAATAVLAFEVMRQRRR